MNVLNIENRAEQITAKISNPDRRKKVKNNLKKFLMKLAEIPDDYEISPSLEPHSYHDDGVPIITEQDMERYERDKLFTIQHLHNYRDDDEIVNCTVSQPMEPPDITGIDTRGKRGYTRLHRAVNAGDLSDVVECLRLGARKDIKDNARFTSLERAETRASDSPTAARILVLLNNHAG